MEPRFENLPEKKLIGQKAVLSFSNNTTAELWKSFMPRRFEIQNRINEYLFSVEIYNPLFWYNFKPERTFEKWAALEVSDFSTIPGDMLPLVIPPGLYAIFIHKGTADRAGESYDFIYNKWLPSSGFHLANRPHFARMEPSYKTDSENSEEEIWIPIREKPSVKSSS